MKRWNDAVQHFEAAMAMNARMGARPWLAHTKHDYARMLLARDEPGDARRAEELLDEAGAIYRELGMSTYAAVTGMRMRGLEPPPGSWTGGGHDSRPADPPLVRRTLPRYSRAKHHRAVWEAGRRDWQAADEAQTVTRCALCPWRFEGTAEAGGHALAEHRADAHATSP
jgi:hypothetical protein